MLLVCKTALVGLAALLLLGGPQALAQAPDKETQNPRSQSSQSNPQKRPTMQQTIVVTAKLTPEELEDHKINEQNSDVMAELADATGGIFFRNNNDLDLGFRSAAAIPGMYYVLGFVPQNLKYDGRFHSIKVTLANPSRWTIQARRRYFAPKKGENAEDVAKQEIEEAIFSQDEMNELPVALHTQFFEPSNVDAVLSVLAHVDLRGLRFRKADGRNWDNLTVVTAIFDRNGNLLDIGSNISPNAPEQRR